MGNPENSPPARPPTVPEEARWDPKDPGFEWVAGGLDAEGRRHGPYRSWTRDGVLHGESNYVHGKVHGKNINFHPDGTIASEADWVMGLILDSVFYRSDAPTTEPFPQAAPNVWSVRYYTRDGKTNYTIRYFTRDGAECGPDGNPLPPGQQGEVWIRNTTGRPTYHYVGAEPRTLDGGWESLGDMGWFDEDGYLYLGDRMQDMILSGGANIYPAEVEAALQEHPEVRSVCVIGLPDEDRGNIVHAIVEADPERLDPNEVLTFAAERLARYKLPRTIEIVDQPLRDDAGKVRRSALRAERLARQSSSTS